MVKNLFLLFGLALLLFSCEPEHTVVWDGKIAGKFTKGDGNKDNPYLISSTQEFALFLTSGKNVHYRLTEDLDMGGTNDETPLICPQLREFSGYLDGGNFMIRNILLSFNDPQLNSIPTALIWNLKGTVKNLGICELTTDKVRENPRTHEIASAGLVAVNEGVISRCLLKGTVSSRGGFVQRNKGIIEYSLNTSVQIAAGLASNGGIAVFNEGTIRGCAFTGEKSSPYRDFIRIWGSIAGYNEHIIEGCYSTCMNVSLAHATINGSGSFVGGGKNILRSCYTAEKGTGILSLGTIRNIHNSYVCADRSPRRDKIMPGYKHLSEQYMQSSSFVDLLNKEGMVKWIADDGRFNSGLPIPEGLVPVLEWAEGDNW